MRRARHAIGAGVVGLLLLAVGIAIGAGISVYWLRLRPWQVFFSEKREIEALLERVREMCPPGVQAGRWDVAWETTYNAFGNVCFSPDHVSVAEMRRLHKDIQDKMAEPPSVEWLRWLWERLGQTGPRGREYTQRMILLFDEAVGDAGREKDRESRRGQAHILRRLGMIDKLVRALYSHRCS